MEVGGLDGCSTSVISKPSVLGSPLKVIFFLAPLSEMHNL